MRFLATLAVAGLVVAMGSAARADWDPNDPDPRLATNHKMHWPQMPDETTNGLDVKATFPLVLADDFQCSKTGLITDIHIWGSWLNDLFPGGAGGDLQSAVGPQDPGQVSFRLSLHGNLPADDTEPFSRPGPEIAHWDFPVGTFTWRFWNEDSPEDFYDPEEGTVIGSDTKIVQYNFFIDPAEAERQIQDEIYWLDVSATPLPAAVGQPVFGWKTARPEDRFMDDAVWGTMDEASGFPKEDWAPLTYPDGHPLQGETLDLAFVITPEPATMALVGLGVVGLFASRRKK